LLRCSIRCDHFVGGAHPPHPAVIDPHGLPAQPDDAVQIVRNQQ
jgi:hypothetical protein